MPKPAVPAPRPRYWGPHDAVDVDTPDGWVRVQRGGPLPDSVDPATVGDDWTTTDPISTPEEGDQP